MKWNGNLGYKVCIWCVVGFFFFCYQVCNHVVNGKWWTQIILISCRPQIFTFKSYLHIVNWFPGQHRIGVIYQISARNIFVLEEYLKTCVWLCINRSSYSIAQFGVINGRFYMFLRLCSSKVLLFPDGQTYWPSKEWGPPSKDSLEEA